MDDSEKNLYIDMLCTGHDREDLEDIYYDDELIEKAADLYIREEDKQIRAEIDELNDFIKCSQKSHQKDGLPTEQTLKYFLSNSKDADELREKEKQKQ